ncbi:CocE/NonD family hydrolase [Novosphingobium album (ex Liu et al. 2023)]|uniref:CocE/NonD family hydrolase n=1 Tax=Novosphingobium album (ex Liu et al. 2023) TaxID=3031130 RepID=A0ABT5WXH0_9SPHN|nr:CocE/NonD family hydrolase [Novosphingobium album (ex Liu et al. 2023)]MDE8654596.1 CocE/NonD family hydrolase [Novosphingobium album (ex Liu et al. 2023)]
MTMNAIFAGDEPAPFEQITIPLSDGTKLAARLWKPAQAALGQVPAVLEWIPYRQSDGTAVGDSMVHGYFAIHGIASVRIDIRGSGNSQGLLLDTYLKQEQDDACEVIAWLAAQPWCNGNVGMIGISWGGFAGLQVAARRPPALKAVITCCSTDDRYRDDVHFMGGALLADGLQWGSGLLLQLARPPDPAHVGERWREMWRHRLENLSPPLASWLEHMDRDAFWRHGSVCENYTAIQCPVYAVSGWTDGYSDAVLRLMQNLCVPRKGLIGPWTHVYPTWGKPGPAIGFLQECVRWWRQWLVGEETGIMDEPMLRLWLGRDLKPHPRDLTIEGRWIAFPEWPCEGDLRCFHLDGSALSPRAAEASSPLRFDTVQSLGIAAGEWCPLDGGGDGPEFQGDSRQDDAFSLCFDTQPLDEAMDLVGVARLKLDLALDGPTATLIVRLNEVVPEGASARVTFAVQRIRRPENVAAGQFFSCEVPLKGVAYSFAAGNRVRLALSTTYWPMVWPEHGPGGIMIDPGAAALLLPWMPEEVIRDLPEFGPPVSACPIPSEELEAGQIDRMSEWDAGTGRVKLTSRTCYPTRRLGEMVMGGSGRHFYTILPHDGASAQACFESEQIYRRPGWFTRVTVKSHLSWFAGRLTLETQCTAFESGESVFQKSWKSSFEY